MRTIIAVAPELIEEAKRVTGLKTNRAAIEEALRRLVQLDRQQRAVRELKGSAKWQGDLRALREDRDLPQR